MGDLQGRVALVTGASHGLGVAIAERLAADGARVACNTAHDVAGLQRVVERIQASGGQALPVIADVTATSQVQGMIATIAAQWGPVAIVVNNATGPQPLMPLAEQTWEDYLAQLQFFVKAPLEILHEVLPAMQAQRYGRIINIGSEVVELGNPEFGHYVAAKAAMLGATRSWANELGPHGITVNLIAPGWVPVERHQDATPDDLASYRAGVPLGRQGVPGDIAAAVAFLASADGAFITGQRLAVNGGKTLS